MGYWICDNCGYGIETKTMTVRIVQCPMCNKLFTLMRATEEQFNKCEMRDFFN